jgi:hypothetical protein
MHGGSQRESSWEEVREMQGQSWRVALLDAQIEAIAKTRDTLIAQRRVATLMEEGMRAEREERRQARGR